MRPHHPARTGISTVFLLAAAFALLLAPASGIPVEAQMSGDPGVFTIGDMTYTSNYPEGMTWTIEASSSAGPITRATVFYNFGTPLSGRVQADVTRSDGTIAATLARYQAGGLIPWLDVRYTWRLIDAAGNAIEVEGPPAVYADATREWQHAENDLVRVYWFGLPDWVGTEALDAVDNARERWALGFPGVVLESRPLVVIYPDLESFLEWSGEHSAAGSIRFVGTLREEWNGTVQRVPDQARLDRECGGLNLVRDFDHVVRALARSTVVHELTHFHQYAMNSATGPTWWVEGQATFFEDPVQPYNSAERVQRLADIGQLPSLAHGDTLSGAGTLGPDGCTHVAYDVGAVFLEFLRDNYGGYEAHGEITRLVSRNVSIYAAIEQVTGRPFAELEAEWRASLGAGPAPTPMPTPTPLTFNFPTPVFTVPGGGTGS